MTRILYLHGFASSPQSGKAGFFAEYFRARGAALEIPALDGGDFEHLTLTGQLEVIGQAARGEPVSLIGSSMGGYLAALYAARHPETRRLILLAPAFGFARRWAETLGAEVADEWRRTGTRQVFHYGENRDRALGYELLADGLNYEDYPDFRQPALIFHGAQDDVVPPDYSRRFAATHANAHLEVLDSGHELHNVVDYMASRAADLLLDRP